MNSLEQIKKTIRDVPDFPKEGILFKDITPVLSDPDIFSSVIALFADRLREKRVQKVVGIDARGFIFGAALADRLNAGFVPVRKKGKLPYETLEKSYALEYGNATVEIHKDAVAAGENVVVIDDLLATGGTAAAAIELVQQLGGEIVEVDFLIELSFLSGREKLGDVPVYSAIVY